MLASLHLHLNASRTASHTRLNSPIRTPEYDQSGEILPHVYFSQELCWWGGRGREEFYISPTPVFMDPIHSRIAIRHFAVGRSALFRFKLDYIQGIRVIQFNGWFVKACHWGFISNFNEMTSIVYCKISLWYLVMRRNAAISDSDSLISHAISALNCTIVYK